jgi:hypothetical protein
MFVQAVDSGVRRNDGKRNFSHIKSPKPRDKPEDPYQTQHSALSTITTTAMANPPSCLMERELSVTGKHRIAVSLRVKEGHPSGFYAAGYREKPVPNRFRSPKP